jgi:hypothetical protein
VKGLSGAYFLLKNVSAHDDSHSARLGIVMVVIATQWHFE